MKVVQKLHPRLTGHHVADVSDNSISSLVSFIIKMNDKIDILVNNAGVTHLPNSMEAISEQEFDSTQLMLNLFF